MQSHRSKRSEIARPFWCLSLLVVISLNIYLASAKVVEFGSRLPNLIEQHPDKNWLVKFYAPWCHHCQQMEIVFNNVAEKIYNKLDNMVVGRVDCTKNAALCEEYNIKGYPVIMFIKQTKRVQYSGERDADDIVSFAERLSGPNFVLVDDCKQLDSLTNIRGRILLSTMSNVSSALHIEFKSLASQTSLQVTWWFYYMPLAKCNDFFDEQGLYVLKRDLKRAIRFKHEEMISDSSQQDDLRKSLKLWMIRESFPVYSQFNHRNFEQAMATGKLLVIAVLDEYRPAKRFTEPSRKYENSFEIFAKRTAQIDDDTIFFWCSDIDLIRSLAIRQVVVPNVMLLKSDYTFNLLLNDAKDLEPMENGIPVKLHDRSIKLHIAATRIDELNFAGGNSFPLRIIRFVYTQYFSVTNLFKTEPLLATILMVFPTGILIFGLLNICFYDKIYGPILGDENQNSQTNHINANNHNDQQPQPQPQQQPEPDQQPQPQPQRHQQHRHNRRNKNHFKQE